MLARMDEPVKTRFEQFDEGRIVHVVINEPARLNAMGSATMAQLIAELNALAADPVLRAVVLTGEGDTAFIGGADIKQMAALEGADQARRFIGLIHQCCEAVRDLPVPVIARINGYCLGAGLELAASCDLRIAASTAVFGMPEVRLGMPSVVEAALLPGLIGWSRARQVLLLGETFGAEEALAWGLVGRVAEPEALDDAVGEWLAALLASPPNAIRAQKQLIRRWEDLPLREAIAAGIGSFGEAVEGGEPRHAIARFLDRRKVR